MMRAGRQKFLKGVVEAVNEFSDDQWDRLSRDEQEWFIAAVKAIRAGRPIVDAPDSRLPKIGGRDAS